MNAEILKAFFIATVLGFIPLPKKLLTIFTLSPLSLKLTNGENVKVVKMSDLFCFLV